MSRRTRSTIPNTFEQRLPELQHDIALKITERRQHIKKCYDKNAKQLPELQIGDEVYAKLHMDRGKLPNGAVISHKLNDRSYIVLDSETKRKYRRNRHHLSKPLSEKKSARLIPAHSHRLKIISKKNLYVTYRRQLVFGRFGRITRVDTERRGAERTGFLRSAGNRKAGYYFINK